MLTPKTRRQSWSSPTSPLRDEGVRRRIRAVGKRAYAIRLRHVELLEGRLLLSGEGTAFLDVTANAGLSLVDTPSVGNPIFGDLDNDGDIDLFISRHFEGYSLYFNDGNGTFTDRQILSYDPDTNFDLHGAAFADFNNDGWLDLFLSYSGAGGALVGTKRDQLYLNRPGKEPFDIASLIGLENPAGRGQSVSVADFDQDGRLDIFIMNREAANVFYHPLGMGRVEEIAGQLGLDDTPTPNFPRGRLGEISSWVDFDNDGDLDLFLTRASNRLLRNDDGTFVDVTERMGLQGGRPNKAIAWGDYNNDGWMDLFVTQGRVVNNNDKLYRNNSGQGFTDVTDVAGVNSRDDIWPVSAAWGDYDNDGYLDLFITNAGGLEGNAPDVLYRNLGNGSFVDVTQQEGLTTIATGRGGGAAWGDVNNDGFLDLVVTNGPILSRLFPKGHDILYENQGNDHHWLKVVPVGTSSNAAAIGAKVAVLTNAGLQVRELTHAGGAFRTQGHGPLHFGLGAANQVIALVVRWPGGVVEYFTNLAADQTLRIVEGQGIGSGPGSPRAILASSFAGDLVPDGAATTQGVASWARQYAPTVDRILGPSRASLPDEEFPDAEYVLDGPLPPQAYVAARTSDPRDRLRDQLGLQGLHGGVPSSNPESFDLAIDEVMTTLEQVKYLPRKMYSGR